MSANDLDPASMERLVEGQARLEALRERFRRSIGPALLDELRFSGFYAPLAERALKKQEAVAASGQFAGDRTTKDLRSAALRLWYFEKRLGRPMPDDIADFARRIGFEDVSAFDAAVQREWLYLNGELAETALTAMNK